MTVTLKGKKYTNIQEFLRQRAGKNVKHSSSEHLPTSSGSAAKHGIGDTADAADYDWYYYGLLNIFILGHEYWSHVVVELLVTSAWTIK